MGRAAWVAWRVGAASVQDIPKSWGGTMELVVVIGLQGAGKSTFTRANFAEGYVHISRDLLRNNRHPSLRQLQLIEEALREGCSIVVDNTHATVADRAPIIALGCQYGARILGYYFPPRVAESLAQPGPLLRSTRAERRDLCHSQAVPAAHSRGRLRRALSSARDWHGRIPCLRD
jgi:AAA domain